MCVTSCIVSNRIRTSKFIAPHKISVNTNNRCNKSVYWYMSKKNLMFYFASLRMAPWLVEICCRIKAVAARQYKRQLLASLRHVCLSVCTSVRPFVSLRGTTRLPMGGFSFYYFSKICRESPRFIEIWQHRWLLYIKIVIRVCCVAHFFLEWEMFQRKAVKKIKRHTSWSITFLSKTIPFMR